MQFEVLLLALGNLPYAEGMSDSSRLRLPARANDQCSRREDWVSSHSGFDIFYLGYFLGVAKLCGRSPLCGRSFF